MGYPKQYRNRYNDLVILFTDHSTGAVIHPGSSKRTIGYIANDWIPCTDTEYWEPVEIPSVKHKLHEAVKNYRRVL